MSGAATSTELTLVNEMSLNAIAVFETKGGVDDILAKITSAAKAVATDISTPSGRAQIKSLAYRVARSKTALDDLGKKLVADLKAKTGAVDAERRRIREILDALADNVRSDLTQWENAEKARVEGHEAAIAELFGLAHFEDDPSIDQIDFNLTLARGDIRDWQEFAKRAHDTKTCVIADLMTLRDHWTQVYADRAEAERLRQEEAVRVQREREVAIAARAAEEARREAEAKAAREAAAAEERARRQQEAAAEKARQEREAIEARAQQEREEATRRAAVLADARRREQEGVEAARLAEVRAREEAEAEIARLEKHRFADAERWEREQRAAIEDERSRVAAEQQALADARAAREADRKHKAKIHREARDAVVAALKEVMALGLSETTEQDIATSIVSAIARGLVPHVRITY